MSNLYNPEVVLREAVEALCDLGVGVDMVMSKRTLSYPLARAMAAEYRDRDMASGRSLDETVEDYLFTFSEEQAVAEPERDVAGSDWADYSRDIASGRFA